MHPSIDQAVEAAKRLLSDYRGDHVDAFVAVVADAKIVASHILSTPGPSRDAFDAREFVRNCFEEIIRQYPNDRDACIDRLARELTAAIGGRDAKYVDLIAACKQSVEQHEIGRRFLAGLGHESEPDDESPYVRQKSALAALGIPTEPAK